MSKFKSVVTLPVAVSEVLPLEIRVDNGTKGLMLGAHGKAIPVYYATHGPVRMDEWRLNEGKYHSLDIDIDMMREFVRLYDEHKDVELDHE